MLLCRFHLYGQRLVIILITTTFDLPLIAVVYLFLVSYGRARPDLIDRCIPHFDAVRRNLISKAVY